MYPPTLTREALQALPLVRFTGKIHLAETESEAETLIKKLSGCQILGFDTETRPSFTKGHINRVALLQLATHRQAYLFRLCKMNVSEGLIQLLSNPKILKVGVALKNDMTMLFRSARLHPRGFVDLQTIVQKFGVTELGLSKMAGLIMGYRISKAQQLSNWENDKLTEAQLRYAATDAWACNEIYHKLINPPENDPQATV